MKYYKYIGSTGNIMVFTSNDDSISAHYTCTCYLPMSAHGEIPRVWARVSNNSCFKILSSAIGRTIIDEAEYKAHVKFALRIMSKQVDGKPYKMRVAESNEVYDFSNFFSTTTDGKWKKDIDPSIKLGEWTYAKSHETALQITIATNFSDPCLNLLATFFSKLEQRGRNGKGFFIANPKYTLFHVANISLNELQKVWGCGTLRISQIIDTLEAHGFKHDPKPIMEANELELITN